MLNPFGAPCADGYREHRLFPQDDEPVRVCPAHSEWLHELASRYELVWGTGWTEADRAVLATVLDLPAFHGAVALTPPDPPFPPSLKTPAVALVAGDRPAAWIDDVMTPEAWEWANARHAPTLLVPVDPAVGLTRSHVDQLIAWATDPH